jgi:Ca2+-binding EF-hand superfamily protein
MVSELVQKQLESHKQQEIQIQEDPQLTIDRVSKRIKERGARGILGLQRQFAALDKEVTGLLSREKFQLVMQNYRISNNARELSVIFESFQQDNTVNYNAFIGEVIGQMSAKRVRVCQQAFASLDATGTGKLEISEIQSRFSTTRHPDILLKRKTEDDVTYEFLDTLEAFVTNGSDRQIDLN